MLLNGSAMYDFKEYEAHDFDMDFFDEEKRSIMFQKQKLKLPSESRRHKVIRRKPKDNEPEQEYEYSSLGEEFDYNPWTIGGILNHPDFAHIKIKIIYRGDIKVNYKSKEEALMDGYTNFTQN